MKRLLMNTAFAILFSLVALHASAQGIIRGTVKDTFRSNDIHISILPKGFSIYHCSR